MTFATPWGLLGLLAVPLVVFVHLFRRHLRERPVAALFLWTEQRLVAHAGRTRTRLLRTPSFWLECLAATTLGLWLGGPSLGGAVARHVVFVLDDSASMSSGATLTKARAEVAKRANALASGDRVTVLRTGLRPEVLIGPRALPGEVGPVLAKWHPVQARHDPLPALDLARELAAGPGEVVFCTDEEPPGDCKDLTVVAFGQGGPNVAILTAQRGARSSGEGEELRLRLGGYGGAVGTQITVRGGEQVLAQQSVELKDGLADLAVELPAGTGEVRVQLAADALAIDNEAWLLPMPARVVGVCDLLPAAQRQLLELDRVFGALRGFRSEVDAVRAQLVFRDGPGQLVAGQTEVVVLPPEGERDAWRGPFVLDRGHPWLAGVQLEGVVWLSSRRTLPGHVLAAVGNQALLSEEFLDAGRRLWVNLDPSAGNAPRSPDWPLLLANVLDGCRAEVPGAEMPNIVLGNEARYRRSLVAGSGDSTLWLEAPDGTRREGHGLRTVGWLLEQPGIHRVLGAEDRELDRFAARFHDPSESDLRGLSTFVAAASAKAADGSREGSTRDASLEQRLLGLLLLTFVVLDWWWLARRAR
jgi:hypothetical protein